MCCTMFAGDQQPVSIKMLRQNLPLNPMKISGSGRLMCYLVRAGSLQRISMPLSNKTSSS
jgi:tRNA G37 N-methylase Trm5